MQKIIIIKYGEFNNNYTQYYINSVMFELKKLGLHENGNKPLRVFTYFDSDAQNATQTAIRGYNGNDDPSPTVELILAKNDQGGVIAHYCTDGKRMTKRQPGSLLKPFIYTTAIQSGSLIPATPMLDEPTNFGNYTPANYNHTYSGWIDAQYALSHSLNVPAVTLLQNTGVEKCHSDIQNAGIPLAEKDKNLALALGGTTYGSTANEICEGYMTLANSGSHQKLCYIRKIIDENGKVLYRKPDNKTDVFSQESAYLATSMLVDCTRNGTAKQLSYLPYAIAAKTGTVAAKQDGNSDAWCAGYTTQNTFVCRFSSRVIMRKTERRSN